MAAFIASLFHSFGRWVRADEGADDEGIEEEEEEDLDDEEEAEDIADWAAASRRVQEGRG